MGDSPQLRVLGSMLLDSTPLHGGRVTTLLALLTAWRGRVVSMDRLVGELWPDDPPESAIASVHVYVSRLRARLAASSLEVVTRHPGYLLEGSDDAIDASVFERLVAEAERATAAEEWDAALGFALDAQRLWRGTPFTGASSSPDLDATVERWEGLRLRVDEVQVGALIRLGRAVEAEAASNELLARDRLNERRWQLRMRAQHAAGDTALALATFEQFRALLREELGVDPSASSRELHAMLLRAEAAPTPGRVRSPTIGRAAERRALERAIDAASAGSGRVVVLYGAPGIGKTVLADAAEAVAEERGLRVVRARGVDGPGTPALWMWEQILGSLTGREGAAVVRSLVEELPEGTAHSEEGRFRLAQAIAQAVAAAADVQPLVVILDDVQWSDQDTLLALLALSELVVRRRCSLVIASRSGPDLEPSARRLLERVARLEHADRFELAAFGAAEVAQLLPPGAPVDVVESHLDRTGGNPYFLSQLIAVGIPEAVPATAVEFIRGRLRDLDEGVVDLLRVAAVVGRSGRAPELAEAADLAPTEVLGHLVTAAEYGLLEIDGSGAWAFPHDLAREAVLSTAVGHHRAALHGRVAAAMARRDPDQPGDREQYAHHCFEAAAGLPSQTAFEACSAAADEAARVLAYDRAATHRARALQVLELTAANRRVRFDTLLALTRELRASGDVVRAAESLRSAVDVARLIGDRELLITAVSLLGGATLWNWRQFDEVDDETVRLLEELLAELPASDPSTARTRAVLLGTLAVEQYYGAQREAGVREADEAAAITRTIDDPELRGRVLNNVVIANWFPGRDDIRLAALDEALGLAGRGLPTATEAIARMHRSSLRLRYADIAGFERDLERAVWLVPRVSRPELDSQLSAQRAGFAILQGDFDRARELSEEGLSRLSGTTLWGSEWIRLIQAASIARLSGTQAGIADELVVAAAQDANRLLRRTAVLVLAESDRMREARELQARWDLRHLPLRDNWASQLEWVQAAETALLLGGPALPEAADRLRACSGQLIDVGTALAVWGTVDDLLARLAEALGDLAAARYRERAAELDAAVTDALGRPPSWTTAPRRR